MTIKRLGIFPNMGKEKVCAALPEFLSMCRECGIAPVLPCSIAADYGCASYALNDSEQLSNLDAGVSLGGDGTLLKMAGYLAPVQVPVFGINFGKLGFLAEIDSNSIHKAVTKLSQGIFSYENRSLLRAEVIKDDKIFKTADALNDLVLAKGTFSKLAHLQMYINGKASGTYAADGIIVATATGSTAYSLSAGGPLVQPELDISVITPVCAHSLTARALVIPMSEMIEFRALPGSEELLLSADGENVIAVTDDMCVRIRKSPYTMQFIRLTSRDYYQTWQQKLMRNI